MINAMATNHVSVRQKPIAGKKTFAISWWMLSAAVLMFAVAAILGFDGYSGKLGIFGPRFEIVETAAGKIIKVPPGGNVQAAIESAEAGDIVELQSGAVYFGEIKLPNKPLAGYVTIQSSAAANLPADKRVSPAQKASMATILSRTAGKAAVTAANGANHYRFVGIEFSSAIADYNYGLIILGSGETQAARIPHDLEIDRSYLHPFRSGVVKRGIALNSANTTIKNSYIEGFGFPGEEAQGICGWTGTRNVRVINNYVEGGAENIMFGGGDPASAELIPIDIEISGNHLSKPAEWVGKASMKTTFELKNAKRVRFTGNLMTNNWVGAAFRITVRNQDGGAPFSTIEDVTIRDNQIDGSGEGFSILGKDDTHPSETMKRLTIENNLFLNLGGKGFDGSGNFIQIAEGEGVTISHNTVFNQGSIAVFYGNQPQGFVFTDNITGHGNYGIHGLDVRSPVARPMFQNNVFINLNRVSPGDYSFPPGNDIVSGIADVGFVNAGGSDFRLSPTSKFRGKSRGGGDIGCDQKKMTAVLAEK